MVTNITKKPPSPMAVFKNRDFSLLWTAQLVETIGCALTALASSILVFRASGSAFSVGLMLMATSAPSVFVGLFAGVIVDRYNRKTILIISDLLRAVLVLFIPFLITDNIVWIYVIVLLTSTIAQFFDPAHESVLPEVSSEEDLAAANSLMAISSFGSTAIGFAASGLIAARYPIEWAFYLNAFSYVFSAACIMLVKVRHQPITEKINVNLIFNNLLAGTRFLFNKPILRSLLVLSLPVFISFGLWNSLLLPFAERALHATEFEYGLQEALTSVGFVIGSLLMANLADRWREGQWLTVSYLGMGLVSAFYAYSTSIPWAIILVAISGFMNAPSSIARRLIVQRNTPPDYRGRVNSAFFVSRDLVFLIGMGAAGFADVLDVRILVLVSALLMIGVGVLALVMPGLGQPAAEWKRALSLLKAAPQVSGLKTERAATLADFDALVGHLPTLARLGAKERAAFIAHAEVTQAAAGSTILNVGDESNDAYFILSGRAVAGVETEQGSYRSLSTLPAGDFFGEIAALTGSRRTANVVADEDTTLLRVPAENLRSLMADPQLSQLLLTKMTERLSRTLTSDLPRLASLDLESIRDLQSAKLEA